MNIKGLEGALIIHIDNEIGLALQNLRVEDILRVHLICLVVLNFVVQHNGEEVGCGRQLVNDQRQDLWTH